jgi:peptidoglycan/LPS O-acetylase OafA/YrhL
MGILDGYRTLAIMLVLAFHYCSRWTPPNYPENLYPYGSMLRDIPIAGHGYLGVQLFFIISGFVIALTLLHSKDWLDFALRRAARLFPTMIFCAVLTFAILAMLPVTYFEPRLVDFLPSLTFIEPYLWEKALGTPVSAIDGAYWSLFVEVKFYFWAGLLFFVFGKARFLPSFTTFLNAVLLLTVVGMLASNKSVLDVGQHIFAAPHLSWFGAGIAFFYLHLDRENRLARLLAVETLVVVIAQAFIRGAELEIPYYLAFYALFVLFVFRRQWLRAFEWKPLTSAGEASYSLYLVHQNVGVTLIAVLGGAVGPHWSALAVPVVATIMVLFSLQIYRKWELPAKRKVLELARPVADRVRLIAAASRAMLAGLAYRAVYVWARPRPDWDRQEDSLDTLLPQKAQ